MVALTMGAAMQQQQQALSTASVASAASAPPPTHAVAAYLPQQQQQQSAPPQPSAAHQLLEQQEQQQQQPPQQQQCSPMPQLRTKAPPSWAVAMVSYAASAPPPASTPFCGAAMSVASAPACWKALPQAVPTPLASPSTGGLAVVSESPAPSLLPQAIPPPPLQQHLRGVHHGSVAYAASEPPAFKHLPPDMLPPASSRSCVSLIKVGSFPAIPVKAPPLSVLALDGMSVPEWEAWLAAKFSKASITSLQDIAMQQQQHDDQQQHYDRGASVEQHGVSDGGVGGVHDVQPSQQQRQQPPIIGPYDTHPRIGPLVEDAHGASVEQHGVSDAGVGGVHDGQPLQQQQQQQPPIIGPYDTHPPIGPLVEHAHWASVEQHGVSDGGVRGVHDVQPSPQQQQQRPPSGVHDVQPLQQQQQWRCDLGTVDELDVCFEVAGFGLRRKVLADPRIMSEDIWRVIIGVSTIAKAVVAKAICVVVLCILDRNGYIA